jgi:NAD(P)-dependent dehydrogenase (short-subunit alcohol dehydrogenase family)
VVDLQAESCTEVAEELRRLGARCAIAQADVAREEQVKAAAARLREELGGCRVLVNTPAVPGGGEPLGRIDAARWIRQLEVNLNGYLYCSREFASQMVEAGGGSMVHVGSLAGHFPRPNSGAYSVTKAGISMMSRVLALELAANRIRSNVVSPGLVRTPLSEHLYSDPEVLRRRREYVPLGEIATTDQMAEPILFLASERASYITGQDILVDGGIGLLPMKLVPGAP